MQDKFIKYLLDPSGTNPDNLVKDESHTLSKNRIRAIAPIYGAFHSESVKVYDVISKKPLEKNVDFCIGGLLQAETLKYGRAIGSVVLVLNSEVSNKVAINYQALGSEYSKNNIGLETLLKLNKPTNNDTLFKDIVNVPNVLKPTFHKHDFGDIYGMEYLVYLLEKLRLAVYWKKIHMVDGIIRYMNVHLADITKTVLSSVDDAFNKLLSDFKANFNKLGYQLQLFTNQGLISKEEATAIYLNEPVILKEEAYLALEAMSALKAEMYSHSVSSNKTNIGLSHGTFIEPNLTELSKKLVGSVYLLGSYNVNRMNDIAINDSIYPDLNKKSTGWTIKKMSGNLDNQGGLFLATASEDNSTYIGKLTINSLNELFMEWKSLLNTLNLDFLTVLDDHVKDFSNPHQDHKSRIKLSNVENLPVVSRESIICNVPVREYMTFENSMLYLKRFQTGVKDVRDIDLLETEVNLQRRMQAIFTPCGVCDTSKDEWNLVQQCETVSAPEPTPIATYDTDKTLVTKEEDGATLTSFLEGFRPNTSVTVKIYRRVVGYEVPTIPPTTPPPSLPPVTFYRATWSACNEGVTYCDEASITLKVGNSLLLPVLPEQKRTAIVKDSNGVVVTNNVTWDLFVDPIVYIDSSARQVIRQLIETNAVYDINSFVATLQPGIMEDLSVRGMYQEVPTVTAYRNLQLIGMVNGVEVGTLTYRQDFRINLV